MPASLQSQMGVLYSKDSKISSIASSPFESYFAKVIGKVIFGSSGDNTANNQHVLKNFLTLVWILDEVKQDPRTNPISQGSCLFNKNSELKETKDVVFVFSNTYLAEGGVTTMKQLAAIGFDVKHKQLAITETDPRIENLAVDLRDGAKLCCLVEALSRTNTISSVSNIYHNR